MFGQLLDRLMAAAKLPAGVFTQVYGDGRVGEALRSDIDAIFFTGSSAVGRKLYKIAAEKFIPVHLELGGSDAGIVCEDANIDEAVPQIFAPNSATTARSAAASSVSLFTQHASMKPCKSSLLT
jgi:acyl-CoA reductase-like NAD-dependent aldehyde dehydrogenase